MTPHHGKDFILLNLIETNEQFLTLTPYGKYRKDILTILRTAYRSIHRSQYTLSLP